MSMDDPPLWTHEGELIPGRIVDRPNRFVLRVAFGDEFERTERDERGPEQTRERTRERAQVHLGDPGVLPTLLAPGNEVLCSPVDATDRVTAYDAIAARTGETTVGLRTTLANDLFERALERDALPWLRPREYASITREPALPGPDGGRTDFLLESEAGAATYVEVKSCSLAREGVARFPDRSTERGRRQLRGLERLAADGATCHVVFVVQRPDVAAFRPLDEVDPEFAALIDRAGSTGVDVRAIVTPFEAPHYRLRDADLPVVDS